MAGEPVESETEEAVGNLLVSPVDKALTRGLGELRQSHLPLRRFGGC